MTFNIKVENWGSGNYDTGKTEDGAREAVNRVVNKVVVNDESKGGKLRADVAHLPLSFNCMLLVHYSLNTCQAGQLTFHDIKKN